jgi:hypothetical protein
VWSRRRASGDRGESLLKPQLIVQRRARWRAPNLTLSDRLLCGVGSLFLDPGRIRTLVIALRPSTLLAFHQVRNLQRVAKMLMSATTGKAGEPYDDLEELYGRLLGQWTLEMNHVAAIIGGFSSQQSTSASTVRYSFRCRGTGRSGR